MSSPDSQQTAYGQSETMRQPPSQGMGEQGRTLEAALTSEMRITLHDFVQAATVCEWCADQCLDEGAEMAECVRLCRDVADLAMQNVRFLSRDSMFGPDVAETFAYAADECARECSQHPQAHCQECATVLRRAVNSTWEMLDSLGHHPRGDMTPTQ